jgi:2-polyprenyl-6-methoxyphenol hydroxylase-like FAD-dependent oxidoreductase
MLMATQLQIGIVGCGTAGPAAAIQLARLGHVVQVFDKAPSCRAVGAGFMLQPTGMAVLEEMGLLEKILPLGSHISTLHVWEKGRTLMRLDYEDWKRGTFGLGLHRPVLMQVLLSAMEQAGAAMHWDHEMVDARQENARWTITDERGREHGPFDLLIIADGARSTLRKFVSKAAVDHSYPWGAHWFIGENNGIFPSDKLHQIVHGTRVLAGFLPTGRHALDAPELLSLFWSVNLAEDAAIRARPLEHWKKEILRHEPMAESFLQQITDWQQVITARYGDVRLSRWTAPGIAVLGDAAHAMSPQLGQGVNLALMDADCLADCIAEFPLPVALKRYNRKRYAHITYYRAATRGLTPLFQSSHDWLAIPRGIAFRTMQHIRPLRTAMTRSMAGVMFSRW